MYIWLQYPNTTPDVFQEVSTQGKEKREKSRKKKHQKPASKTKDQST